MNREQLAEMETQTEAIPHVSKTHRHASITAWFNKIPLWVRWTVAATAGIVVVAVVIPGKSPSVPSTVVMSGEFIVDLTETGKLRAENSVTVTSPTIRVNLQIVDLVPEGALVETGDFLVQFDTTEMIGEIDENQAQLDIARSNLTQTLASMKSKRASMESSIENARASYRLAQLRLEQMKFEADMRLEEGRLNLLQAEISLKQSEEQLKLQRQIDAEEIKSLELKIRQEEIDLEKANRDLEKMRILAPKPGLVVYRDMWRGGEWSKMRIGDTPWRGHALIELPDMSVMLVETSVSEVDVAKVKLGQEVEVKLDAYPEPVFHGKVIDIAALASSDEKTADSKVFDVLVRIDESDPLLKPGMSASARIIVERIPHSNWIPIESVFERDGEKIVWVLSSSDWKRREVMLGARNDNFVIVQGGIEAGETVALVDPESGVVPKSTASVKQPQGASNEEPPSRPTASRSVRGRRRG